MVMAGMAQQVNYADKHDDLDPRLDPHADWVELRVTPEDKVNNAKSDLSGEETQVQMHNMKLEMLICKY